MAKKRFELIPHCNREHIWYGLFNNQELKYICNVWDGSSNCERLLNEQHETIQSLENEKEEWKHSCIKQTNKNSILWNEISIMREQGAEPSDAFKKYLDSISTEYERFWNRKKEKAKEDKVILND